jgi:RIP metalloprotease RseP
VTETIDPSAGSAPEGTHRDLPVPKPGGTWTNGDARFVREDVAEAEAPQRSDEFEPQRSKLLPSILLLTLGVIVLRFFGWWGMFIILGLLVSVTLHELGHFLTARQADMKVTEFFFGFGPRIWSTRRGEVEYGVKALPFGAYVRIIGMNDLEEVDPADEGRTYREKSYWARLRVVLAGPFMNFAIGFLVLIVLYMSFGVATDKGWTVDRPQAKTAAAAAGFRTGDRLISVDGKAIPGWSQFSNVIRHRAGDTLAVVVQRGSQRLTLRPTVGWVLTDPGSSKLAPLEVGDAITKVGATTTATYAAVRAALSSAPKGTTTVELLRDGNRYRTDVHTPVALPADGSRGFLGISAAPKFARQGPLQAVHTAGSQFVDLISGSVGALGRFFSPSGLTNWTKLVVTDRGTSSSSTSSPAAKLIPVGNHTPAAVSNQPLPPSAPENNRILSFIGVLRLGSQAGSAGFAVVLFLLALINVFLGLINLVPLPPFDGGHAAVATYEAIREKLTGRPYRADMAKLIPVTYAVLALMVFVFVSSSYLDLFHPASNPFKGP